MTRKLYFAYGSNLHLGQMSVRCPGASPVARVTLRDHRLIFRGVADVVYSPGDSVEGAVYSITPSDELALDRYEGFIASAPEHGLYRKEWFRVRRGDGSIERVMFYAMNRGKGHAPSQSYLRTIREGYADWGIDEASLLQAARAHGWTESDDEPIHWFVDGEPVR